MSSASFPLPVHPSALGLGGPQEKNVYTCIHVYIWLSDTSEGRRSMGQLFFLTGWLVFVSRTEGTMLFQVIISSLHLSSLMEITLPLEEFNIAKAWC